MTITLADDKVNLFYQPHRSFYAKVSEPEVPAPELETSDARKLEGLLVK